MEVIKEYWHLITGFIVMIVWLTRVDANTKQCMSEVVRLDSEAQRDRSVTNELLREVRGDIKSLLRGD